MIILVGCAEDPPSLYQDSFLSTLTEKKLKICILLSRTRKNESRLRIFEGKCIQKIYCFSLFSDIWSLSKCEVNVEKYSNILILQSYQWRRWHYYNDDQIKILSTLDLQWNGEKQINREFGEVQEVLLLEDVQGHDGQAELAGDEAGLGLQQTLHWQTHDTETEDIILQRWTQEEEVKLSICDGEQSSCFAGNSYSLLVVSTSLCRDYWKQRQKEF